jgi:hypothetical protein
MRYTALGVRHALVIAALSFALAAPVSAKPQMTDNRDAVAHKLNEMGFVSWKRLTRHPRFWRVKDARRDNGNTYDLKLERGSLEVMKLKRDRR